MKSDVFFAFLGGVVLGGVTALLLAPRSGEDTRKNIGRYVKGKKEKFRNALESAREDYDEFKEDDLPEHLTVK